MQYSSQLGDRMNSLVKAKLELLPEDPGCYLMKDKDSIVIYVGKAKNLKNRVRSYFTGTHNLKTTRLVSEIRDFEIIITDSEVEALLLEINLIKKYNPKYNILLKDDKTYPYIQITDEEHPRLIITRNVKENKGEFFGPYPNVSAAREVKNMLDKMFPLRKCHPMQKNFCLYYHIKQCLGPCGKEVDPSVYEEHKAQIRRILKGNTHEVIKELRERMMDYADNLQFEKAQEMKELIEYLNKTVERQKIDFTDMVDRDIFGYYAKNGYLSIQVFYMRSGKFMERDTFITEHVAEPEEELKQFIIQFYESPNNIKPKEILIPNIPDVEPLATYLNTTVLTPKRGDKKKLVDLASENAKLTLENRLLLMLRNEKKTLGAMEELAEYLGMESIRRIEAFDNSHISGSEAIGAMVVYVDGKPSKQDYRKFKIKFANEADDYDYMREVLYRRYLRVLRDDLPRPDLIVIDGGKGQVNVCKEVLASLNLSIRVIGLVKNEKHKTSEVLDGDTMSYLKIKKRSQAFRLLVAIQEEVHRFAITYHRQLRRKKVTKSFLDDIKGVGPKRKQKLLRHFGSIKRIKEATIDELMEVGIPYDVCVNIRDKVTNSN